MVEGREVTHTEKAYCCSNYPQTEATLIAKFDVVTGVIGLLTNIIILSVAASNDVLEPASDKSSQNQAEINAKLANDPSMIIYWPKEKQILVLSLNLAGKVVVLAFSVLLFIGVKKRNHAYLLTWFIFTIISVMYSVISGVATLYLASSKLLLGFLVVVPFLYNWYCLWIVKLLMSEIRAVREGYTNPLDDGEIENANNLVPSSDSFTVDKF